MSKTAVGTVYTAFITYPRAKTNVIYFAPAKGTDICEDPCPNDQEETILVPKFSIYTEQELHVVSLNTNQQNEKLMNADLLVTIHTNVTTAQHTVPSMAKYRMFELVYTTDDDAIWAQNSVIPASIFKSGIQMRSYYGVENTTTFCTYLDDTHVNMYNNSGRYARLYGLY